MDNQTREEEVIHSIQVEPTPDSGYDEGAVDLSDDYTEGADKELYTWGGVGVGFDVSELTQHTMEDEDATREED